MIANFDRVLIVISTDFFSPKLLGEFSAEEIEATKEVAREEILIILDGSDNYYMCADFSVDRRAKTKNDFFAKLQARGVGIRVQRKINFFYDTLEGISNNANTAIYEISHVASALNCLQTEELISPISDEMLDCLAMIEAIDPDSEQTAYIDEEDLWLQSTSDWDKFLMSILDGITGAPATIYNGITKLPSQLDFLHLWKAQLGGNRFAVLKEYIRIEAHAQLEEINPDSASEIDDILAVY